MVVVGKTCRPLDLRQRVRIWTRLANLPFGRAGFGQVGWYILTRGLQNGADDALVTRAAAVGVFECCTDIGFGDRLVHGGLTVEQALRGHDQSGRTDSALHGTVIEERLLQRVQFALLRDALDRLDRRSLCFECRVHATDDGCRIDEHRADAALGFGAAYLGAREPQVFAQHLGQVPGFGYVDIDRCPVHCHLQATHGSAPARSAAVDRMMGRYVRIIVSRYCSVARYLLVRNETCWRATSAAFSNWAGDAGLPMSTSAAGSANHGMGPTGPILMPAATILPSFTC